MIRLRYAALLLVPLACTPQTERPDSIPAPSTGAAGTVGTIAIVGSAPVNVQVVLRSPNGESFRLVGALEPELQRLSGIQVAVEGQPEASPDPLVEQRIEVVDYEIISVDGEPVLTGEIIEIEGDRVLLRTRSGEEVYLTGAPAEFRVGQKVWVQGPSSVAVQSYGTIRP